MSQKAHREMLARLSSPRYLNLGLTEDNIAAIADYQHIDNFRAIGLLGYVDWARSEFKHKKPYAHLLFLLPSCGEGVNLLAASRIMSMGTVGIPLSPFVNAFFPDGTVVPRLLVGEEIVDYFIDIEKLLSVTNHDLLKLFADQWRFGFDNDLFIYPKIPA